MVETQLQRAVDDHSKNLQLSELTFSNRILALERDLDQALKNHDFFKSEEDKKRTEEKAKFTK